MGVGRLTLTPRGKDLIAALQGANSYGLEASDFTIPALDGITDTDKLSAGEITLTRAALLYARYARGGRIMKPAEQLNSISTASRSCSSPKPCWTD